MNDLDPRSTMTQAQKNALPKPVDEAENRTRNAFRISIVLFIGILVSDVFTFILAYTTQDWRRYVIVGFLLAYTFAVALSIYLIKRRNRSDLGAGILISGLLILCLAVSVLTAGVGWMLGLVAVIEATAIANLTLPSRKRNLAIIAGVMTLVATLGLDFWFAPSFRATLSDAGRYFAPVIAVVVVIISAILIAREYGRYALRTKLAIAFLIVTLVPLSVLALIAGQSAQDLLIDNANEQLFAVSKQTASELDTFISDNLAFIAAEAQLPIWLDVLDPPTTEARLINVRTDSQTILDVLRSKDEHILSYSLINQRGVIIASSRTEDVGINYSERAFFEIPVASGFPYASGVEFSPRGQPSLYFAARVIDDNREPIGALLVQYDAGAEGVLQNILVEANGLAGNQSFGVLFERIAGNHIHLAHGTAPETIFQSVVPLDPEYVKTLQERNRLPELSAEALSLDLPRLQENLVTAYREPFFPAEDIATGDRVNQVAVSVMDKEPWLVAFFQPRDTFIAASETQVRIFITIALVLGGVVSIGSVFVAQVFARPITLLTAAAAKVSQGDLDVYADVQTSDEIGVLATTFNNMTIQLRELIGTLEARIEARTSQLLAAAEIGRTAASVLDPDSLLHEVVGLITDRLGYYYAAVFTVDEVGRYAVLREATGEGGKELMRRGHRLEVGGQSMVGAATVTRKPRIALDVGEEAMRFANPLLLETRSEIALPLVVGNRVIGALDVQSTQEAAFDEASATVLQSMADLIAVALNNAEQFKLAELQSAAQNDLILLSSNLFAAPDLQNLYRTLVTGLGTLVPHDYLSLALHESSGPTLREYELRADHDPIAVETQRRSVVDTLAGQAFTVLRAVVSTDVSLDARSLRDMADLARSGLRSALSVPLVLGDRVLGTMNFASRDEKVYSPRVVAQATQVAAQVTGALENVRLTEERQRNVEELQTLASQLTGEAWQELFRRISDGGYQVQYVKGGVQTVDQSWLPEVELAVLEKKPVAWSQRKDQIVSSPFHAAMAAPIILRGEPIGALQVGEVNQARVWTAEDLAFIQAVADQVALAVENARLTEEAQRTARRDKAIAEAADRIHRPTDLETILRSAIEEVMRITGVSEVSIQLGEPKAPNGNGQGNEPD